MAPTALLKQLETARFEKALLISESMAEGHIVLNTTEIARLNNMLTGKTDDPFRKESVSVTLRSGDIKTLAIVSDPKSTAREILHYSAELAEKGLLLDAAMNAYVSFVLSHVFEDANRRTAALVCHYFLKRYGFPISGVDLHEIEVGDLRDKAEVESLRLKVANLLNTR